MFKWKPSLKWLKWAEEVEKDVDVSAGRNYLNPDESAMAALEHVSRVLDDVFKQRLISDEYDAMFIFKKMLSYQGLKLEGQDIVDAVTGRRIAVLGSVKISSDMRSIDVTIKLEQSLDFILIDVTVKA